MIDGLKLLLCFMVSRFRSERRLEAEIVVLRHQLNVLRRKMPSRPRLTLLDRLIFVWLYRCRPAVLNAVTIVRPETVVRWHRDAFRLYWRWKSRAHGGRPRISSDLRRLIREKSVANPLWGAPRIHGEILKLGVEIAQSTVAKYMVRGRRPPSQSWKTFLRNHGANIAAMDLMVVPTIGFPPPLCPDHPRSSSTADPIVRCHLSSDGGVDRATGHRCISVDRSSALSDPRSRCGLRSSRDPTPQEYGHP